MANVCNTDLMDALKGIMSKKEIEQLRKKMESAAKARQAKNLESKADALKTTVEDLIKEVEDEKLRSRKANLISIIKNKEIFENVDRYKKAPWRGMEAELDAIQGDKFAIRAGCAKLQFGTLQKLWNGLMHDLQTNDVYDLFLNLGDKEEGLAQEMHTEGTSKDKNIRLIAKAMNRTLDRTLKLINKSSGANIKKRLNYVIRQMHNPQKLRSPTGNWGSDTKLRWKLFTEYGLNGEKINNELNRIAYDRWKNTILPELDTEKVFGTRNEKEIEDMIREDYDNISTGEFKVYSDDEGLLRPFRGSSFLKKLSAHRTYVFKDGSAFYRYQQAYGYGRFTDQFVKQIYDSSRQIGFLEKFGPHGRAVYDNVKEKIIAKNKKIPRIRKKFRHSDNIMLALEGRTRGEPDNLIGHLLLGLRSWRSANLGSAVLSSIPDIGMRGSKMQSLGESFFKGELDAIGSLLKTKEDVKTIGKLIGSMTDGQIGAALSRFSASDSPFSTLSRINSYAYKFNLLHAWDALHTTGWGEFLGRRLAGFADRNFSELPEGQQRSLIIHGIGEKEWDVMRDKGNRPRLYKNQYLMVPDAIKYWTKESVAKYLDKDVSSLTDSEFDDLKEKMETRWFNYFSDDAQDVIASPSVSTQAIIQQGTRGDEIKGILLRYLGQFQGFPIEATRRTFGRFIYGGGAETIYQSLAEGTADIKGMVQFMLQQTKWGYLSMAALNLANGLQPPNPYDPKTFVDAFERGGAGAIYFSLLSQSWNKYNRDMGDMFVPRALSTVQDMFKLSKAIVTQDHPLFALAKLGQRDMPPLNLFYTKTAINHLFLYGLMEYSKPGYLDHLQNLAEKDGDRYYLAPSEHTNLF